LVIISNLLLDNIAYFVRSDANHSCVLPVISDRFLFLIFEGG
jgi:hypothetical protein